MQALRQFSDDDLWITLGGVGHVWRRHRDDAADERHDGVDMEHHLLLSRLSRPHGRAVLFVVLEGQAHPALGSLERHPVFRFLIRFQVQQPLIEIGELARITAAQHHS
jgi:hypothetical protein